MEWIAGFAGSWLIAWTARRKKSLSMSGMWAAVVLGTLMFVWGNLSWYGTLIAFFVSSSLLSHWKKQDRAEAEARYARSGERDAVQVAANGGLALLACWFYHLHPHPFWWMFFIGVLASVNADTWATEIGGLSRSVPRLVTSGKPVPPGTSGGVTVLGLFAAAAGGLFIGGIASMLLAIEGGGARLSSVTELLLIGGIAGVAGSLADFVLGASCQAVYRCRNCDLETEKHRHCGRPARKIRGAVWMNNDAVNVLSSAVGGTLAGWSGWLLVRNVGFPFFF